MNNKIQTNLLKDNLTIVIPCKNEGLGLVSTLEKILLTCQECKIIISDSSTDNTLSYLNPFSQITDNIKIVKGGLPSVARNNGFQKVQTPYVLFLDADMDISKVKLDEMLDEVIRKEIKLSTCKITTRDWKYSIVYKIFYFVQWIISFKTPFAVGGFMLFESEEFRKLKGFGEDDKFAEDFHLSMKIQPKEFKIFNYKAYTSTRRFKNKGILYMCKMMIRCWLNRNNEDFYKKDYDYWS